MQLEPVEAHLSLLEVELACLSDIKAQLLAPARAASTHFLRLLTHGTTERIRFLVMQRAGRQAFTRRSSHSILA